MSQIQKLKKFHTYFIKFERRAEGSSLIMYLDVKEQQVFVKRIILSKDRHMF